MDCRRIAGDEPFGNAALYFTADACACEQCKRVLAQRRHFPLHICGLSSPWGRCCRAA